jgi:membrane-associated phospholipid phosphatase
MLQTAQEWFLWLDYNLWYLLNSVWRNDVLDAVVPYIRNQWTWAPLYLFLLVLMLRNFRLQGVIWCLFFIATFAISDQISAHFLKEIFQRIRPCNNDRLTEIVHTIVQCGSGYSFPSSHAANHFALGVFGAVTMRQHIKGIWTIAMIWAGLVAYAQVYVGVHFPMDVIFGGLLGAVIGRFTAAIYHHRFRLTMPPEATVA